LPVLGGPTSPFLFPPLSLFLICRERSLLDVSLFFFFSQTSFFPHGFHMVLPFLIFSPCAKESGLGMIVSKMGLGFFALKEISVGDGGFFSTFSFSCGFTLPTFDVQGFIQLWERPDCSFRFHCCTTPFFFFLWVRTCSSNFLFHHIIHPPPPSQLIFFFSRRRYFMFSSEVEPFRTV